MKIPTLNFVIMTMISSMLTAKGALQTRTVDYSQGGQDLQGFLAYDDAFKGPRPGILVVHQWLGLTAYEKRRAEMLAQLGYVAFCADIYGVDKRPHDVGEAAAISSRFKSDRNLLRARVNAGLEVLREQTNVDTHKLAAIGYCFGGTTVIELARSGADIAGVVSFHGGLDSPTPSDGRNIRCKVLALAGADDPFQNANDLEAFENEMRNAGVDWQITFYGGAVHAFTQPDPGFVHAGVKYNEKADHRSWQAMKDFFAELFPGQ